MRILTPEQVQWHNRHARVKNSETCRLAIGKSFRVKVGNTTYIGVVATCEVATKAFRVTIRSEGGQVWGPFLVKKVPTL